MPYARCTIQLRVEQCCGAGPGCRRPARFGGHCAMHFMAARPAERATCLLIDSLEEVVTYARTSLEDAVALWALEAQLS